MKGRKPTPTALKDLHGSTEPRNPNEPIPEGNLTERPAYFNDEQRQAWDYALDHSPPGMLKRIDGSILECWVVAHCLMRQAVIEQNRRVDLTFTQGPQETTSPLISIIDRQSRAVAKYVEQLGFSPVSRPRILGNGPTVGDAMRATNARAPDTKHQSLDQYIASAPKPPSIN